MRGRDDPAYPPETDLPQEESILILEFQVRDDPGEGGRGSLKVLACGELDTTEFVAGSRTETALTTVF